MFFFFSGCFKRAMAAAYKQLIRELYVDLNPAKLETLNNVFARWVDKEKELYEIICKKYAVEPLVRRFPGSEPEAVLRHSCSELTSKLNRRIY